jgi:protein-S-isoprenylcysteine O-methyltransferase Ste14
MMRALELRIPPPVVALLVGAAMWFAAGERVPLELPFRVRLVAFVVIALAGGAIALAGDLAFRRARTTISPFKPENSTALVTSGIYRFTRNPMYVGLTLVVLGWTVFLCSAWALLGPVAFVLYITRFQILPEERVLSAKFGGAYTAYAARVRRWL